MESQNTRKDKISKPFINLIRKISFNHAKLLLEGIKLHIFACVGLTYFPKTNWKVKEMNEVSAIACPGCSWQHFTLFWSPSPSLVSDSTRHFTRISPLTRGVVMQWPAPALPRPNLSKLQTVQRVMEQTSHYAIITSTTLNTLSTLIIGLHLECQVLFFKSVLTLIKIEVRVRV